MKGLVEGKKIILSPISLISSEPESLIRSLVWGDDVLLSLLELWVFLVNIRPVPSLSWSAWASWSIGRNCYVRWPSVKALPIKPCTLSMSNMLHPFPSIRNNSRNWQAPPLVLPRCQGPSCSARANPRLGEPCFQSPERPATWNSLHLEFSQPGPGDGKCKDNEDRQRECRGAGCSSYFTLAIIYWNFETKFENDFYVSRLLSSFHPKLSLNLLKFLSMCKTLLC